MMSNKEKQIYDLNLSDLIEYPVWYFPMDETCEDELSIRPFDKEDAIEDDHRMIVKTKFKSIQGKIFLGYIYWNQPEKIEDLQPVMFFNESLCITFWNGMMEPSWEDYKPFQKEIIHSFPYYFESEEHFGLNSIKGTLEGLYFIDDKNNVKLI